MTFQGMVGAAIAKTGGVNRLARHMAVTGTIVTRWRDGLNEPTPEKHQALAELIGIEVDELRKAIWESKLARMDRRRRRPPEGGLPLNGAVYRKGAAATLASRLHRTAAPAIAGAL